MKVNEIFYSLQGEGANTGTPAIFVRFSGCNMKCHFCDTNFNDGKEMTEEEIVDEVCKLSTDCHFVVLTGGEPTLQVTPSLVDKLHQNGYMVGMESNGTNPTPFNINWLTISPKAPDNPTARQILKVKKCHELKLVFGGGFEPSDYGIEAQCYYLQPCDTGDATENERIINDCITYIKQHPKWKLSLQTQKILKVR